MEIELNENSLRQAQTDILTKLVSLKEILNKKRE